MNESGKPVTDRCEGIGNCSAQAESLVDEDVRKWFKNEQIPSAKLIFMDLRIVSGRY